MFRRHLLACVYRWAVALSLSCATVVGAQTLGSNGLVDDRVVTLASAADVASRRARLIDFIWGPAGWPAGVQPQVRAGVAPPLQNLRNLKRVDRLELPVSGSAGVVVGRGWHFVPARSRDRAVIVHHGHACTFDDATTDADVGYGLRRMIENLLEDGYGVVALTMPLSDEVDCSGNHTGLFAQRAGRPGDPYRYFLEPVVAATNLLRTGSSAFAFPRYRDVNMLGLSGGGWTTTLAAALDPRIATSIDIAGSLPLYLRDGGSVGDLEQFDPSLYRLAGYPDLYLMGASGANRRRVQVLNRRDDCCFGVLQHNAARAGGSWSATVRNYERDLRQRLPALGGGSLRVEVDEAAPVHLISWNTAVNIVLAELNESRRVIGARSTDAYVRGLNGNLWHRGAAVWVDLGYPMVGAPVAVADVRLAHSVFFRDPDNRLQWAWSNGSGWTRVDLGFVSIADPSAGSGGTEHAWSVTAVDAQYHVHRFHGASGLTGRVALPSTVRALGPAAIVVNGTAADVFVRGFDRGLWHIGCGTLAPHTCGSRAVGGQMVDFPTAAAFGGASSVFVRGLNPELWEAHSANGGFTWAWRNLSQATGTQAIGAWGTPQAHGTGGLPTVYTRSGQGALASFEWNGNQWMHRVLGGVITYAPAAIDGGAAVRGTAAAGGGLFRFDGTWQGLGGLFD